MAETGTWAENNVYKYTLWRNIDLPTDHSGLVAWMSCSQPDAWCHRMKLKSKGREQVTVLLAVIIIYSNKF